jgi:hypothetical protein
MFYFALSKGSRNKLLIEQINQVKPQSGPFCLVVAACKATTLRLRLVALLLVPSKATKCFETSSLIAKIALCLSQILIA